MRRLLMFLAFCMPAALHAAELRPMPKPDDAATSEIAAQLGRELAYDPRMSRTRTHSCMTCHLPERGYSDGLAVSIGATENTTRNAPTLLNSGYRTKLFHDFRADLLEGQADQPLQSVVEMGQGDSDIPFQRIAQIPHYQQRFQQTFGRGVNRQDGVKAMAAFMRTLVSTDAPIDRAVSWRLNPADQRWYYQKLDAAAWVFNPAERRGFDLFFGKAGCVNCHMGPDGRLDGDHRNIGLAIASTRDQGIELISNRTSDRRSFAVPTLREVQATAPYGHAGQLRTLADVVAFKNNPANDQFRSPLAGPLYLNAQEQSDLVAFLSAGWAGKYPVVTAPFLPPDPPGYQHFSGNQNNDNGRRLLRRRR